MELKEVGWLGEPRKTQPQPRQSRKASWRRGHLHVSDMDGEQELMKGLQERKQGYHVWVTEGFLGSSRALRRLKTSLAEEMRPQQRSGCGPGELWACLVGEESKITVIPRVGGVRKCQCIEIVALFCGGTREPLQALEQGVD